MRSIMPLSALGLLIAAGLAPQPVRAATALPISSLNPLSTPFVIAADVQSDATGPVTVAPLTPVIIAPPHGVESLSDPCGDSTRLLASLNRPTVGYSTCTTPAGSVMLEEGYQVTAQGGASAGVSAALMQGFQRFGLGRGLEFDLIGPTFNRSRSSSGFNSGYSDIGYGVKFQVPIPGKVQYALDGLLSAPSGGKAFTAGTSTQQLNVDAALALTPSIGIGTTLGFAATGGAFANGTSSTPEFARYGAFIPSVVVTDQLNRRTQVYAEGVGQSKIAPDLGGRLFADVGIQRLIGQYVEVDAEYGMSFTPVLGSRFHYVGFGVGIYAR